MAAERHVPDIYPLGGFYVTAEAGNIMLGVFEGPHPAIAKFVLCEEYSFDQFEIIVTKMQDVLDRARRGDIVPGSEPEMVFLQDGNRDGH